MALRLRMCARGMRSDSGGMRAGRGCLCASASSVLRAGTCILLSACSCKVRKTLAGVVLVRLPSGGDNTYVVIS